MNTGPKVAKRILTKQNEVKALLSRCPGLLRSYRNEGVGTQTNGAEWRTNGPSKYAQMTVGKGTKPAQGGRVDFSTDVARAIGHFQAKI